MQTNDHELLRRFARQRDDGAFRELVQRHLTTVFAVALRVTGDRQLAEEIAQSTFAELAGKAASLKPPTVVAGWLYRTARHLALRGIRTEQRRRQREQHAATLIMEEPASRVVAEQLDAAMDRLTDDERDVLILRFFEEQNLRDVGRELGLTEDAARMRVNRALDKLRDVFGKLGVTGSAAWLATTLPASASATVPAGLSSSIVTSVLGGAALATAAAAAVQTTTSTMNLFNLKTAAAILGAAAVTGGSTYLVKNNESDRLRGELQTVTQQFTALAGEQRNTLGMIQLRDDQIEQLKQDAADIHRLRGEVDRLNRKLAEMETLREEIANMNKALAAEKERLEQDHQSAIDEVLEARKELEKEAVIRKMNDMRQLGLALHMHANANRGWFPDEAEFALLVRNESPSTGANLEWVELSPDNVVVLFQGHLEDISARGLEPRSTIVARQRDYTVLSDGRIYRAYGFVDGHSEIVVRKNLHELAAWEAERTIPPENQSRQPR